MRFFVVAPDGQKYGPADMTLLTQWVQEGRILPGHELEEEGTGRRIRAEHIPGLGFQQQQPVYQQTVPQQPPATGTYIPPSVNMSPIVPSQSAERLVSQSWNMGIAGLVTVLVLGCCPGAPLLSAILAALGITHANNAKGLGTDKYNGPLILNIIVLVLAILALFGSFSGLFNFWRWF